MAESGLNSIGVIGIGVMGNGIAQVCAQCGFETKVMDVSDAALERGMNQLKKSLERLVAAHEKSGGEKGLSAEQRDAALARLSTTTRLEELLHCELIIEAVPEKPELKEQINRRLGELGFAGFMVSNTSGISITRLATAFGVPARYMGMHFMNPVPLQQGVEIIRGLLTSDETYAKVVALCHDLGKTEIAAEDKAGFAINRMWVPFVNEAIRVVEEGVAAVEDVDKCTLCLGHKMGPLLTADYVGLDTMLFIAEVLAAEYGSPYLPSPLLRRLVEAGCLGAKNGLGFYSWADGKPAGVNPAVARYRIK